MVTTHLLNGVNVVVTRPVQQATELVHMLSKQGAIVTPMAMIVIEPVDVEQWPALQWAELDMVIFVSQNAVHCFMAGLTDVLPDTAQIVAVGAATANCLSEYGFTVDVIAPPPAGSESLLALAEMQTVVNKRILIVRGNGGRELIAETLQERGAKIQYLSVYQRRMPIYQNDEIAKVLNADWLIVTSVSGLKNLWQVVNDERITQIRLLVVSERIRQVALDLGFQHVVVSDDATDAAVVERIVEMGRSNGK